LRGRRGHRHDPRAHVGPPRRCPGLVPLGPPGGVLHTKLIALDRVPPYRLLGLFPIGNLITFVASHALAIGRRTSATTSSNPGEGHDRPPLRTHGSRRDARRRFLRWRPAAPAAASGARSGFAPARP